MTTHQPASEQQQQQQQQPLYATCAHYCERKKRRCKFGTVRGSDYCVEHLAFNSQEQTDAIGKRVICPLDPKHSVFEKNFAKHLTKCNSRVRSIGPFDIKDINSYDSHETITADANNNNNDSNSVNETTTDADHARAFKRLESEQLESLVQFVVTLDAKLNLYEVKDEIRENAAVQQALAATLGETSRKHLAQISSIVTHVDSLFSNSSSPLPSQEDGDEENRTESSADYLFVELGAGRGKLSYWFEQSRSAMAQSGRNYRYLLVERGCQRLKFDTQFRKTNTQFERIRIDLKDLYMNKLPIVEATAKYVLVAKHLCGVASDYAIRCMKNALGSTITNDTHGTSSNKCAGLVLALCCHHKCEWSSFCGKEYMRALGIDEPMFYLLRSMTSWSVCDAWSANENPSNNDSVFGHSKQRLGKICKNLFDKARLNYLQENIVAPKQYRLNARLVCYVEPQVTLENTMIVASFDRVSNSEEIETTKNA